MKRWWVRGNPYATVWFNVHSASFPRGEVLFIDAVKAHRQNLPPKLDAEIRSFIKQEANHSREHLMFNRLVENAGYSLDDMDKRMALEIAAIKAQPPIMWLAVTIAIEHYTAIISHEVLANPAHLEDVDPELSAIWRWHSIEEIEHKAVAYDTWLHATRDWSRLKRWFFKSRVMVVMTAKYLKILWTDCMDILSQDELSGLKSKLRLIKYTLGNPGPLRRILIPWLHYFKPGFHPWQIDDRDLITKHEAGSIGQPLS